METISTISVDDVAKFIRITDEVLNIDNVYRHVPPSQPPHLNNPRPPPNSTVTHPATPILTAQVSSSKVPQSSLVCTNCHAIGHLVNTCFKAGGGLEGKRKQYMVSRGRVQAHLAHLTDILDGNTEANPDR